MMNQVNQLPLRFACVLFFSILCEFLVSCSISPGAEDEYPRPDIPLPTAVAHNAAVSLSWPAVANASEYLIYWSMTPGGTRVAANPIVVTELSYQHAGRSNGVTYYYAVTAKGKCCESALSSELAATPQSPPNAPQNVRAVMIGGVTTVDWEPAPTAERYTVHVVSGLDLSAASLEIKKYLTSTTAIAFGNLDDAKTYRFTITASNVGGEGEGSTLASVTPVTVAIASGANHSCALRPDRALECWGANTEGQLGLGDNALRYAPVQVGADFNWRSVAAGAAHTCAINTRSELFCWGRNNFGQLGGPAQTYNTNPSRIGVETDWYSISAGTEHTCAIKTDHTLWCWGSNITGQLGVGELGINVNVPTRVTPDPAWASVSAGENHTCAVQLDGALKCWGKNTAGQLGVSLSTNSTGLVQVGEDRQWTTVAAGSEYSCALKTDTSLWCWGQNTVGQLGNGKFATFQSSPQQVGTELGWTSVDLGHLHSCATRIDGRLWCWGGNAAGQLDVVDRSSQNRPVEITTANSWYSVALGNVHTCALFADGRYACWGDNLSGQLGKGRTVSRPLPVSVSPTWDWQSVYTGWYHVCAIKTDFSLWCWGGSSQQGVTPVLAGAGKAAGAGWQNVAMAHFRACALRADATIWCTSMNYGFIPRFFGSQQFGASGEQWRQVVITDDTTCALRVDQTLWCWGTSYDSQAPAFDLSKEWAAIALTPQGLCAIKIDGSHWCQLNNTGPLMLMGTSIIWKTLTVDGRCGITSTNTIECRVATGFSMSDVWTKLASNTTGVCAVNSDRSLWCNGIRIGTENNWDDISVSDNSPPFPADVPGGFGDAYYCGIKLNHSLWCWGYTRYGQLANSTIASSSGPVSVQNAAAWRAVSAGVHHTCAIAMNDVSDVDQRLYCWGDNSYGQLGISTTQPTSSTPVAVDSLSRWIAVATGAYHSCGIKPSNSTTSGTLWCWGANGYGQVGVNSIEGKFTTPTKVSEDADWSAVAAGEDHTCALKESGALWCWGYNAYGQVGVGSRANQIAPLQIDAATQWKSVASGGRHTCATTFANLLRCWGANDRGQLGTGDTDDRLMPTAVQEDVAKLWTTVAAGSKHTCAISASELWCWGDNNEGQLADATEVATRRLTPKLSTSSVLKVSSGGKHSCVTYLDKYGIWCAGANDFGQLGDGTTFAKTAPTQCNIGAQNSILNPRDITASAGGQHTCAIREDGTLMCWGDNTYGQVGSNP